MTPPLKAQPSTGANPLQQALQQRYASVRLQTENWQRRSAPKIVKPSPCQTPAP